MKILSGINVLIVFCCGVLCAAPAESKVCFAGDGDCGGIETFGGYTDPSDNLRDQCAKAGYETNRSECTAVQGKQITDYCPYDSNFVKCCSLDYIYDSCVYPMVQAGKCGSKYKCVCDTSKYKYTAEMCKSRYQNTIVSGASCAQMEYNASAHTSSTKILFTDCSCDRGLYPKTESECSKDGSLTAGNVCQDTNGNKYYAACLCGPEYSVITANCEDGTYVNDPLCRQGDVYKAKRCCYCNSSTYPYRSNGSIDSAVATYATCEVEQGCTRGGDRYRATSCKPGYKVVNGKCEPKECGDLITDYLTEKRIGSYAVYSGGTVPSVTNIIVAENVTNVNLNNLNNKKVISGVRYAQTIYGSDSLTSLIKSKCTKTPKLESATGTAITGNLDMTSVGISLSGMTTLVGNLVCTNCFIEGDGIFIDAWGKANLQYNSSYPNANNMYIKSNSVRIMGALSSKGYNYEMSSLNGGTFSYGLYIDNDLDKIVKIEGRSNGERATIKSGIISVKGAALFAYTNIYPGYDVYIGSTNNTCSNSTAGTFASLYYSALYLKSSTASHSNLYICSKSAIGYPDVSGDYAMSKSYGSYIITTVNYYGIRAYRDEYHGRGEDKYKFINSSGYYQTVNHWFFTERTSSHSHNNEGTTYKLTGENKWSIVKCYNDGKGCDGPNRCLWSSGRCDG